MKKILKLADLICKYYNSSEIYHIWNYKIMPSFVSNQVHPYWLCDYHLECICMCGFGIQSLYESLFIIPI